MITHSIPHGDAAPETASVGVARTPAVRAGAAPKRPAGVGGYGPLRVQLHLTARHQRAGLDPGPLPRGTRGGHREGSRAQAAAGFPGSGGRPARSTGMMASRDSAGAVAGGLARHIPVLGRSVVELLDVRAGEIYVDATFGAGGHSSAILAAANCNVIAIDRDPNAIARGADLARSACDRLALVEDNFSDLQAVVRNCGYEAIDGVVFDLGVSSMQLDEGAR